MTDLEDLTLEEKASLASGSDFWHTEPIERVGIPELMLTDGPHGLRKQAGGGDNLGLEGSIPATCFPPLVGMGSSWDPEVLEKVGEALGEETSIEDVAVVLGPGINIKRSPLCGRNFEYISEDPIVAGVLGAAYVNGVQSKGVGTSVKHFAANNQEEERMRASSNIDERTLREIYLRAFQRVVEDAQPWTIMCSYNRINGVHASSDRWLLTDVLRSEWGFKGLVVSDWGATVDRVKGIEAGMDLEMPATAGKTDAQIVAAVKDGSLDEAELDITTQRVLDLIDKATEGAGHVKGPLDVDAHHEVAREVAGRSMVLLRNKDNLLPLSPDAKIAVIGAFAEEPRYQGAGSSMINPTKLDKALDGIREVIPSATYAKGFGLGPGVDAAEEAKLKAEAVAVAKDADVAVVFLGLPARLESEGYDRSNIDLPQEQLDVLDAVLTVNPNVVVVLSNGSVVALPFKERVPAILEAWLLGQAGGTATADVLFGKVNPSGKLTETIPVRLEDTPAYLNFPGEFLEVNYGEGQFVGYRWYDARGMDVTYPFGYGLSYTTFDYSNASIEVNDEGDLEVSVDVTNTGGRDGREVVQVYTGLDPSTVQRPVRELKAFASTRLAPGETKTVTMLVRRKDLAYWDTRVSKWVVEGGNYTVDVAASSRDIRQTLSVEVEGEPVVFPLSYESSLDEALTHPVVGPMLKETIAQLTNGMTGDNTIVSEGVDLTSMIGSMPLGSVVRMGGGMIPEGAIDQLIAAANTSMAMTNGTN
ncbi:glycoside hydrolase family 3 C-terminal domain-containing protein [Actinomycetaceae bacterium MB13-C1-2]|nr:glycoside hydrolase family 3 C-terminal domain-containing protein [Actinomycetaceae bacterium MB13-C1-2]